MRSVGGQVMEENKGSDYLSHRRLDYRLVVDTQRGILILSR